MRSALAAIAVSLALAAPASAARPWVVSGSLAGTYTNTVAWGECTGSGDAGTAHETLSLDAKISPGKPAHFRSRGFGLPLRLRPGGSWSDSGSFHPTCGAPQSFQCSGRVLRSGRALTFLALSRKGRSLIGGFLGPPYFTERVGDVACLDGTMALLGLRDTQMEADALVENDAHPSHVSVPSRRFRRGRPFTIRHVAPPDGGCPGRFFTACTETGRITLTLRFSHPRR
jgi:hypothetical protein